MVKDYLELVPVINNENTWMIDENNIVVITKENNGMFRKIMSKYKNIKDKKEIELDSYGSFVWKKINGEKTICDIVNEIVAEMGEEKETACKRAAIFFEMLRVHRLINFIKD